MIDAGEAVVAERSVLGIVGEVRVAEAVVARGRAEEEDVTPRGEELLLEDVREHLPSQEPPAKTKVEPATDDPSANATSSRRAPDARPGSAFPIRNRPPFFWKASATAMQPSRAINTPVVGSKSAVPTLPGSSAGSDGGARPATALRSGPETIPKKIHDPRPGINRVQSAPHKIPPLPWIQQPHGWTSSISRGSIGTSRSNRIAV